MVPGYPGISHGSYGPEQKGISLALLCLEYGATAGLMLAIRLFMTRSGDPDRSFSRVISDVETASTTGSPLTGKLTDHIRGLLLMMEKQAGSELENSKDLQGDKAPK